MTQVSHKKAIVKPDWSLKRLAWGYGCAKTGSEEEAIAKQRLLDGAALELAGFDEDDPGLPRGES